MPIIENTARESELTERLSEAIKAYPKSQAVLVRRHGVYVWGSSWIQAKTQSECYDYLFECALKMKAMGIDASKPAPQTLGTGANGISTKVHALNGHAGLDSSHICSISHYTAPSRACALHSCVVHLAALRWQHVSRSSLT